MNVTFRRCLGGGCMPSWKVVVADDVEAVTIDASAGPSVRASAGGGSSTVLKAYYLLKPIIPRAAIMTLRRLRSERLRRRFSSSWPIDRSSAGTPPGWPGWPQDKKFALV